MKKTTANWLAGAAYDFETAGAMFRSKRYLYVVFFCHLAIEKTLKGLFAEMRSDPHARPAVLSPARRSHTPESPPRLHRRHQPG
jgi:HEPN domain-containing protein